MTPKVQVAAKVIAHLMVTEVPTRVSTPEGAQRIANALEMTVGELWEFIHTHDDELTRGVARELAKVDAERAERCYQQATGRELA